MARRVTWESLGGCLRPWRDERLRALLAHVQRLRQSRPARVVAPESPRASTRGIAFSDLPKPWLDDRLKKLVAHIERLRRNQLMGPFH
jgi:hypothetical protein